GDGPLALRLAQGPGVVVLRADQDELRFWQLAFQQPGNLDEVQDALLGEVAADHADADVPPRRGWRDVEGIRVDRVWDHVGRAGLVEGSRGGLRIRHHPVGRLQDLSGDRVGCVANELAEGDIV